MLIPTHPNWMLQPFMPSLPSNVMTQLLLLHLMRKSDCAFKTLDQTLPQWKSKPLADSPEESSNRFQIGVHGMKVSTNKSTNSMNEVCSEIQLTPQHLTPTQSSAAQHSSMLQNKMEPVDCDCAVMKAKEQRLFSMPLLPLGHALLKCQSKGHSLPCMQPKAARCVVLMCKMHVHTPKHVTSKPTCKLMMHALNASEKSWEKKSIKGQ